MKKKIGILWVLLLSLLFAASVRADDGSGQKPDYATDYYMIVECAEGGVDIYAASSLESEKLNHELIPNGTALHIMGEKSGEDDSHWVYVQYHGMYGYVPSDHLKPVTVGEAAKSEYRTYDGFDVEFEVKIKAPTEPAPVYKGPGDQFGTRKQGLEDKTAVSVTQYVETSEGRAWGKTSAAGVDGWVDLMKDTDYAENEGAIERVAKAGIEAGTIEMPEQTPVPIPTVTPALEPTAAPKSTAVTESTDASEPTVTVLPTVTAKPAAAAESAAAPKPTITTEPTATEKPEETAKEEDFAKSGKEAGGALAEEEGAAEEKAEEALAEVKETKESSMKKYLLIIFVLLLLAIAVLSVYLFKNK